MRTRTVTLVVSGTLALLSLCAPSVAGAAQFASPAFQRQWGAVESVRPNFWGPQLSIAPAGQQEAYKEASGGMRLTQYFDKARMELTNPATGQVTNGLLTVEMKSGRVQIGDATFSNGINFRGTPLTQPQPAGFSIAGDFGDAGPTYADLNKLPERDPAGPDAGAVSPLKYDKTTGRFVPTTDLPTLNIPPGPLYTAFVADSGGRYGQYVFRPFYDFIHALPLPMDQTTGYPISPLIVADVSINGKPTTVLIQAFERRVLTFNPNNVAAFQVEFGNIGLHYYEWRYHPGA